MKIFVQKFLDKMQNKRPRKDESPTRVTKGIEKNFKSSYYKIVLSEISTSVIKLFKENVSKPDSNK